MVLGRRRRRPSVARDAHDLVEPGFLEALGVAVYTTDADGVITQFNEAAAELWGRRPEIGIDRWCGSWRLFRPDGTPMAHDDCPMGITLRENRPVRGEEAIAERPDGTRVWFVPYPTPLHDTAGNLVGAVNVLVDVTDRKKSEEAALYLNAIITSSDDAIVSKDLTGTVTSWNRAAERMFGFDEKEMIGRSIRAIIPPERLSEEDVVLGRIRRGQPVEHFETIRRRKDGSELPISLSVSPVKDRTGKVIGASKIARDISQRREAEQALAEALAAKDEFIGMVSHELRTPITTIMGNASVLERHFDSLDRDARVHALRDIATESRRLHQIIEDMLVLARLEASENDREPVRMEHLVDAAVAEHRKRFPRRDVTVVMSVLPIVTLASRWIDQVLRNLMSNAEKYSPVDQPIEIVVGADADGMITVSVRDRGPGVPESELEMIFSPFYRAPATASQAQGVGIGLAVCKRLIEAEGGQILAALRPDGGLDVSFSVMSDQGSDD